MLGISPSLTCLLTIPLGTLTEAEDEGAPEADADEHRTPKILAEAFPLSDSENEAYFPFTDFARCGRGRGVHESIEAISGLGARGLFVVASSTVMNPNWPWQILSTQEAAVRSHQDQRVGKASSGMLSSTTSPPSQIDLLTPLEFPFLAFLFPLNRIFPSTAPKRCPERPQYIN